MIHYTCDRCKNNIDTDGIRHVVKIEVQATIDNGPNCLDEDRDHLVEIEEILARMEEKNSPDVSDEMYQRKTFDLCPNCYRQFARNPLSQEAASHYGFSEN